MSQSGSRKETKIQVQVAGAPPSPNGGAFLCRRAEQLHRVSGSQHCGALAEASAPRTPPARTGRPGKSPITRRTAPLRDLGPAPFPERGGVLSQQSGTNSCIRCLVRGWSCRPDIRRRVAIRPNEVHRRPCLESPAARHPIRQGFSCRQDSCLPVFAPQPRCHSICCLSGVGPSVLAPKIGGLSAAVQEANFLRIPANRAQALARHLPIPQLQRR